MNLFVNGIKYTKYILIFGTCSKEWVRFAASMASMRYSAMIYDACITREVFLSSVGEIGQETVRLREKIYTTDLEYMMEEGPRYDLVLIYDDFSQCSNYARYGKLVDYAYIGCSALQYSIAKMNEFCDEYAHDPHFPFSFVFDGDEREAEEWEVLEHWRYLTTRRQKEEGRFFIPRNEKDRKSYLSLEFGRFCFGELSEPMQSFLLDVARKVSGREDVSIMPQPVLGV